MTITQNLSRRTALAGLAGAAAVGIPASVIAGKGVAKADAIGIGVADGLDWPAIILRAEGVVEILKRYYGPAWTAADQEAADGMLKHVRDHAPEEDEAGLDATYEFMKNYNQSYDWIFHGDPISMVAGRLENSPRGAPESAGAMTTAGADPAIAVVEEWYAADSAYSEVLHSDEEGHGPKTKAAVKRQSKAMNALFNVTPTTSAGAVALLEALANYDSEDGEPRGVSPLEWWGGDHGDGGEAVNDTLLEIVDVLRATS
jgi:hypothetical protein